MLRRINVLGLQAKRRAPSVFLDDALVLYGGQAALSQAPVRHGLDVLQGGGVGKVPEVGVVRVGRAEDHGSHIKGR
jgi:hypothetical protein